MKSDHDRNGPQYPELKISLNRGEAYRLNQLIEGVLELDPPEALVPMDQEDKDLLNELDFILFEYLNKYL